MIGWPLCCGASGCIKSPARLSTACSGCASGSRPNSKQRRRGVAQRRYVREDLRLRIRRLVDGSVRVEEIARREPGSQIFDPKVIAQWLGPMGPPPAMGVTLADALREAPPIPSPPSTADAELERIARVALQIDDAELAAIDWERWLASVLPEGKLVVRVMPVRCSATLAALDLPLRIVQTIDGPDGGLGPVLDSIFGSHDSAQVRATLQLQTMTWQGLEALAGALSGNHAADIVHLWRLPTIADRDITVSEFAARL